MFHDLPEDLATHLLLHWVKVNVADLGRLDVAYCSHSLRNDWLHLLPRLRLTEVTTKSCFGAFILWLHSRNVHFDKIVVVAGDSVDGELPPQTLRFPTCASIKITGGTGEYKAGFPGMHSILELFPSLTSIDCGVNVRNDQMIELFISPSWPLKWPLRQLNLSGCSIELIVAIVVLTHETLEDTEFNGVTDWAVRRMAECCRNMKVIRWTEAYMSSGEAMVLFCTNNPLVKITIDCYAVDNEVLQTIFKGTSCCLRTVVLLAKCKANFAVLSCLADHPSMRILCLRGAHIDFHQNPRTSDVRFIGQPGPHVAMNVLTSMPIPIGNYYRYDKSSYVQFDGAGLRMLASNHGSTLKCVQIWMYDSVVRSDVRNLLTQCHNLLHLDITFALPAQSDIFQDEDIRALPTSCPHLVKILLTGCAANITDEAVTYALQRLQGNGILRLAFRCSALLSDALLPKIVEYCPKLAYIDVSTNTMTKEGILDFIISSRQQITKKLSIKCNHHVVWIKEQLQARQLQPNDVKFVK